VGGGGAQWDRQGCDRIQKSCERAILDSGRNQVQFNHRDIKSRWQVCNIFV
jgi:hypothetical protein